MTQEHRTLNYRVPELEIRVLCVGEKVEAKYLTLRVERDKVTGPGASDLAKATPENRQRVQAGMSAQAVMDLLGPPEADESGTSTINNVTRSLRMFRYRTRNFQMGLTFVNDQYTPPRFGPGAFNK